MRFLIPLHAAYVTQFFINLFSLAQQGASIERYSAEQICSFADKINALPRKALGYCTPKELFEKFLDQIYSVDKVQSSS